MNLPKCLLRVAASGRKLPDHSVVCLIIEDRSADPIGPAHAFGLTALADETMRDLLEILDDRFDKSSTIVTSQLPVAKWHEYLADPTLADAILDRIVHNAYKIELKGESMRKKKAA